MAHEPKAVDSDALLEDFAARHPLPSVEDIVTFQQEHPELATSVMDLAMALLGASITAGRPEDHVASEEDVELVVRAMGDPYSRRDDVDLIELIALARTTPGELADELILDRKTMGAIVDGRAVPPMPRRMREMMSVQLGVSTEAIDAAFAASSASPLVGLNKASSTPKIVQRSFADLIATSGMSKERKAFWMEDD